MNTPSLSNLSPTFFLQTFILELMHACEQQGQDQCENLIEHIAKTAGCFFEKSYRKDKKNITDALDKESYIELILGLKNNIGGNFSLQSSTQERITVTNTKCPFGSRVTHFPELCRMTSSVFGGIAARNLGYAKVEIKKSIAKQDGYCEVCIHTNSETAKDFPGIEYTNSAPSKEKIAMEDLQSRIDQSLMKLWYQEKKNSDKKSAPTIIAKSPSMQKVLQAIEIIAPTSATVLIQGPTGAGKELIARAIHGMSERSSKPFIAVNCGAIPESLIESVLFGHEKGAFTGAVEVHQGYFERAEGGTLFLDEVDSLSLAAQSRLLRIIQEGELERIGGKHTIHVDLRIISATNQILERKVDRGEFRNDLFYRINVIRLIIPPLAERPEDLPYLVQYIIARLNIKHNKKVASVSREVMQKICTHHWPGNVRELENTLERSLLFAKGPEITELDFGSSEPDWKMKNWKILKENAIAQVERAFLKSTLLQNRGDVKKTAAIMELTTRAIYDKIKKHDLCLADFRGE